MAGASAPSRTGDDNAIERARDADLASVDARAGRMRISHASEHYVGLPDGQMGNSEVGHTNIGAGRVVMQDLPRIDQAIADGSSPACRRCSEFIAKVKATRRHRAVMGLMSPGGVHSHQHQIAALAAHPRRCRGAGRGARLSRRPRHAAANRRSAICGSFRGESPGTATCASRRSAGRYYAMDRDKRWDRVEKAYRRSDRAAEGEHADDAVAAVEAAYAARRDRRVRAADRGRRLRAACRTATGCCSPISAPTASARSPARCSTRISPASRATSGSRFAAALGLTEYSDGAEPLSRDAVPAGRSAATPSARCVAEAGLKQLRIAETEKYAHVTFFFNGGRETVFPGEERILVPSPKVATYDQQPEMSAPEVTDKLVEAIRSGRFDVDRAELRQYRHGRPYRRCSTPRSRRSRRSTRASAGCPRRSKQAGGTLVITADHGNAEMMRDPETGEPHTAHTLNPVPLVIVNPPHGDRAARQRPARRCRADPARHLGLPQPPAMTGHSLIHCAKSGARRSEICAFRIALLLLAVAPSAAAFAAPPATTCDALRRQCIGAARETQQTEQRVATLRRRSSLLGRDAEARRRGLDEAARAGAAARRARVSRAQPARSGPARTRRRSTGLRGEMLVNAAVPALRAQANALSGENRPASPR